MNNMSNVKCSRALVGLLLISLDWANSFNLHHQKARLATFQKQISDEKEKTAIFLSAVAEDVNGLATINGEINVKLSTCEKARTVTSCCKSGTLCTVSSSEGIEGAPFGSFVDYVLDEEGNPVFLMNERSMHTTNIRENSSGEQSKFVTLFTQLTSVSAAGLQMQDVSRCSVTGTIEKLDRNVNAPDMDSIRMCYSISHAYAEQVMDSPKFQFYRLRPSKIYFVGGFGVQATWVPVEDYFSAKPDILAKEAAGIVSKLNRESMDDLRLVATQLLFDQEEEVERIRVTNVDRLGMDMRVTRKGPRRNKLVTDEFRLGFRIPVISVEDAKSEIQKVFQEAWEREQGYTWGDDELPGSDVPIIKIAEDSLG